VRVVVRGIVGRKPAEIEREFDVGGGCAAKLKK
jgi:hypothetical protein